MTFTIIAVGGGLVVAAIAFLLLRSVRVVGQGTVAIVERLGRYHRTLTAGPAVLRPGIDRVRAVIDLREQVIPLPPQPVFTADNIVLSIDVVVSTRIVDPKAAVYEIANFVEGIEQLVVSTLREIVAGRTFEQTLRSRKDLNAELHAALHGVAEAWGIHVARVAVQAIELPKGLVEDAERLLRAQPPQPIDAPQVVYHIGTVSAASNFGGSGTVDAPAAYGERSRVEIHQRVDSRASLDLVQALIRAIQANAAAGLAGELEDKVRIIQGEVLAADAEKRPPDRGRIKAALAGITQLAGAGGSIATAAEQIGKLFGLTN